MKTRINLIVIFIVIMGLLGGMATYAWFTDSVTSSQNKFQAGTLKLGGVGEEYTETFAAISISNIEPGAPAYVGTTQVRNIGTLPLKLYRITASNIDSDIIETEDGIKSFDDVLNIRVFIQKDGETHWEPVYTNGKIRSLESLGYFDPVYNVAAGQIVTMKIEVTMDSAAGNEYRGKGVKFDLTLHATQNRNPVGREGTNGKIEIAKGDKFTLSAQNGNRANSPELIIDLNTPSNQNFDVYGVFVEIFHESDVPQISFEYYFKGKDIKDDIYFGKVIGISDMSYLKRASANALLIEKAAFPADWEGVTINCTVLRTGSSQPMEIDIENAYWSLKGFPAGIN